SWPDVTCRSAPCARCFFITSRKASRTGCAPTQGELCGLLIMPQRSRRVGRTLPAGRPSRAGAKAADNVRPTRQRATAIGLRRPGTVELAAELIHHPEHAVAPV